MIRRIPIQQRSTRIKHGFMILALLYLFTTVQCLSGASGAIDANVGHLRNSISHDDDQLQTRAFPHAIQPISDHKLLYGRFKPADHSLCSEVHNAQDQCAWILESCDDQDSGLLSYLELYYCKVPQAKPFAMAIMLLWLSILFITIGITASDYFCVNLNTISALLGLSESVAGVTLLAFGNGSPDVFATWAAMSTNSESLAIGELIGAAGFITGVVAGSMAIIRPFKVAKSSFMRDLGFFIVAIAFSFGFLVDGHLELWESIAMVAFYCFYGIVVIVWHWRAKRRKARETQDQLARQQFLTPEYTDEPHPNEENEDSAIGATRHNAPEDQFHILVNSERNIDTDIIDEYTQDHHMAEIMTGMRIRKPRGISRENTRNSIRPSLVGALEFRAVLSSLERSRGQLSIPLYNRRYSDDIVTALGQQHRLDRAHSDMEPIKILPTNSADQDEYTNGPISARPRAVSTNDIEDVRTPGRAPLTARLAMQNGSDGDTQLDLPRLLIPIEDDNEPLPDNETQKSPAFLSPASANRSSHSVGPASPTVFESPTAMHQSVASLEVPGPATISGGNFNQDHGDNIIQHSEDDTHFAPYHDDPRRERRSRASSLQLPPPALQCSADGQSHRFMQWWPHRVIPPPEELFATLFPTLCSWSQKSHLQKLLAVITAPSVLVLNITLPVVEMTEHTAEQKTNTSTKPRAVNSHSPPGTPNSSSQTPIIQTVDENGQAQPALEPASSFQSDISTTKQYQGWQRWLLCTQLTLSPLLVVAILWVNLDDDHDTRSLLFGLAAATIFSILALTAVLLTSSTKESPRYRPIFCALGFIVSVSWISTIANEVVGVLKALGIILNISEAILGLTVFAVGSR